LLTADVPFSESRDPDGAIHDRVSAIIAIEQHTRWLGTEQDPRDLLQPFPGALTTKIRSPQKDSAIQRLLAFPQCALARDLTAITLRLDVMALCWYLQCMKIRTRCQKVTYMIPYD